MRQIEDYCLELFERGLTKQETYNELAPLYFGDYWEDEVWDVIHLCYGEENYKGELAE